MLLESTVYVVAILSVSHISDLSQNSQMYCQTSAPPARPTTLVLSHLIPQRNSKCITYQYISAGTGQDGIQKNHWPHWPTWAVSSKEEQGDILARIELQTNGIHVLCSSCRK